MYIICFAHNQWHNTHFEVQSSSDGQKLIATRNSVFNMYLKVDDPLVVEIKGTISSQVSRRVKGPLTTELKRRRVGVPNSDFYILTLHSMVVPFKAHERKFLLSFVCFMDSVVW